MTKEWLVYADTLNLLGTGVNNSELQKLLDVEHAEASEQFKEELEKRNETLTAA